MKLGDCLGQSGYRHLVVTCVIRYGCCCTELQLIVTLHTQGYCSWKTIHRNAMPDSAFANFGPLVTFGEPLSLEYLSAPVASQRAISNRDCRGYRGTSFMFRASAGCTPLPLAPIPVPIELAPPPLPPSILIQFVQQREERRTGLVSTRSKRHFGPSCDMSTVALSSRGEQNTALRKRAERCASSCGITVPMM